MRKHGKAVAVVALVACLVAVGGLVLTRQVMAVAGEVDSERLHRAILAYIAEKNPQAPIRAFQKFPEILLAESSRAKLDHCLALAQAEVESDFRHDAVGAAGEIGLFQILPSTAALFETSVGPFRRPAWARGQRDLGDLADPEVSARFAMAYLRDIMTRKPSIKDALTEYNGGPTGRHPHYYRMVMGTYVEVLERKELRCRFQPTTPRPPLMALLERV
jgi:soluble lytic murein transglycosylase-like protein